jgi:hypothetical protein
MSSRDITAKSREICTQKAICPSIYTLLMKKRNKSFKTTKQKFDWEIYIGVKSIKCKEIYLPVWSKGVSWEILQYLEI